MLMMAGCTYAPPEYRGQMESAALLGESQVAVGYSQRISRRPTGLTAFPDGGAARILHDEFLVAVVDRSGRTREIARQVNEALPGTGNVDVSWFEADPRHLYVTYTGQLTTDLPLRRLHDTHRMDLNGRDVARFDLYRELAALGRDYGAKGFGGALVVDARGTMLAGATRGGSREVWRRDADGRWTLLDEFDGEAKVVRDDLVYRLGDHLVARNWRSGDMRKLVHFDPSTSRPQVLSPGDPALITPEYIPTKKAMVIRSRGEIQIMRDNDSIASIQPNPEVLDRR